MPYQVLPLRAKVDLGVMAIKGYSAFPKAPELLEPHHQIVSGHTQDTRWGDLTPLQRSSWCILQLQPTGQIGRWNQARMLIKPWSRCFKRIGGIQSVQNYLKISTWPQYIAIYNLPTLENKIGKMSKLDVLVPHMFSEKNKEDHVSIATSLLSKQRKFLFLKNIITSDEK